VAQYKKGYMSGNEYAMRFNIFKENLDFINEHNSQDASYSVAINQFTDLTNEEFRQYLGYRSSGATLPSTEIRGDIKASVDWRAKGAVTPVQNQGACGSCWAFSATGAVEGSYFISTGQLVKFSEQQLVDCDTEASSAGCNGGLMTDAFEYLLHNDFVSLEHYPYTAKDETCNTEAIKEFGYPSIRSYHAVDKNSADAMKDVLNFTPVSVAVNAGSQGWQFYSGGVVTENCGQNLDHGVLAVGYGEEDGQGYFIVKNSWGSGWGEDGYIRVGTNDESKGGVCGILMDASYTLSRC